MPDKPTAKPHAVVGLCWCGYLCGKFVEPPKDQMMHYSRGRQWGKSPIGGVNG